jgi:predicted DNA-binding protein YlxM (UPF0122 family)
MKEELIQQLEDLLKEDISSETLSRADEIKNQYLRVCEQTNNELLQGFLAEGGQADDFEAKKDPLDNRFNELLHIFVDRDAKFRKMQANEIASKLKEKEQVIADLEKLINEETNIGKAFQTFKELQTRWNEIGNVPSREYKNLQSIYHRHAHNFYYNMKLSKDLRELDFKRNYEQRSQLLVKIESLLPMESVRGIERMINLYRMEWSELGPTAPETVEPLRTRYRELIGQVYQKIRSYHQEKQQEEVAHLETKKKILERAKGIAAENFDTPKQWQTMTETLNKLFDEWKATGFGPKSENDKVWEEFRAALNEFYRKKRDFFGDLKKGQKDNRDKKLAIITKAEEISKQTHENFDEPTKQILQLQADWKNAGHIEQWEENKLWKRFREACDAFFNLKRERFSARDQEQQQNLLLKEELIKKVEEFQPTGNSQDDIQTVRGFSDEWKTIQHVPIKDKQRVWEKFRKAIDNCYDKLKLESNQRHLLKFRSNVESLTQSEDSGNLLRKEKNAIRDKINKLQATINQYENNLGFFRNSKNMAPLLTEVESNLTRAKEEMQMLQQKLKMFATQ